MHDDSLMECTDSAATRLLDEVYCTQVEYFFPVEVELYVRCSRWMSAGRVLDVGTGNGCFIERMARAFNNKSYIAVEIAPEQLSIARERSQGTVGFLDCSAETVGGTYDAILMRFVAQHLTDVAGALRHLRTCLRPGGIVYITEGIPERVRFVPRMSAFEALLAALQRQRRSVGRDMCALNEIEAVAVRAGLTVVEDHTMPVTAYSGVRKKQLAAMEAAILSFLKHQRPVEGDYDSAFEQLQMWATTPMSFGDEPLRMTKLIKSG